MTMIAAQVIGNDATITIAGQSGNFQLNVMLPVIAYNLLQSLELLGIASRNLADHALAGFVVNEDAAARGARPQSHSGDRAQSRSSATRRARRSPRRPTRRAGRFWRSPRK